MEIIKRGTDPKDIEYELTCSNCKTIIRAKRSECSFRSCYDGSELHHSCPVCGKTAYYYFSNCEYLDR
jgi:hypothetical protein